LSTTDKVSEKILDNVQDLVYSPITIIGFMINLPIDQLPNVPMADNTSENTLPAPFNASLETYITSESILYCVFLKRIESRTFSGCIISFPMVINLVDITFRTSSKTLLATFNRESPTFNTSTINQDVELPTNC